LFNNAKRAAPKKVPWKLQSKLEETAINTVTCVKAEIPGTENLSRVWIMETEVDIITPSFVADTKTMAMGCIMVGDQESLAALSLSNRGTVHTVKAETFNDATRSLNCCREGPFQKKEMWEEVPRDPKTNKFYITPGIVGQSNAAGKLMAVAYTAKGFGV
jgi:hypothetical protein